MTAGPSKDLGAAVKPAPRWALAAWILHSLIMALVAADLGAARALAPPNRRRDVVLAGLVAWVVLTTAALIPRRLRRWSLRRAGRPLLLFLALVAVVLAGEIAMSLVAVAGGPPVRRLRSPSRAELELDPGVFSGVGRVTRITVNPQGLRGPPPPDGPGAYRIIAVGGSTTEGWVLDDRKTWPAQLMDKINRRQSVRPVWVGNAGILAHCTLHHLEALRRFPVFQDLDMLLFLVGFNDLYWTVSHEGAPTTELLAASVEFDEDRPSRPFLRRLWTYQMVSSAVRSLAVRDRAMSDAVRDRRRLRAVRPLVALPDLRIGIQEYGQRIRDLIARCRATKKRCGFMTQPTLLRADLPPSEEALCWLGYVGNPEDPRGYISSADGARAIDAYNEVLRNVCREDGIECFDIAGAIEKSPRMFLDECHFTEAGAEAVASAVADQLLIGPPWH